LLVIISLLPTLIYFYSVYALGNPVGAMDTGGTWGAYIGLFFLAAIYVAIGLLASALTDNQIFSFILAMGLSFIAYLGFDMVGAMQLPSALQQAITSFGINEHYNSISRGVVDSRDMIYFLTTILLFLFITSRIIHFHRINLTRELKLGAFMVVAILVIGFISHQLFFRLDMTAEKRYSITDVSKQMVKKLERPVDITLYLAGELPAGFRKLQKSIEEKIADYNAYASQPIHLKVVDPYEITDVKQRNQLFSELTDKGLLPTDIRQNKEQGTVTLRIFPGVLIYYGEKRLSVNLLKNNPALRPEVNLNNSIETLEYEFTNAFSEMMGTEKQTVAFLSGHGELNEYETNDFAQALSEKYKVTGVTAGQLNSAGDKIKALIIANPTLPFAENDKFYIDQYVMKGGRILWLVDPVMVSLDSLSNGITTLAFPQSLNLEDQFFKYGIRLNTNLVQDVECLMLPVNTAPKGQPAHFEPAPWYFSPLLIPSEKHVISRNLNRVKGEFVSSIDTVGKSDQMRKTVILTTSPYSLVSNTPMEISLASINNPPDRRLFHQPSQTVGVLLEGTFPSVFANRMVSSFGVSASDIKTQSVPNRMIVLSDGSLVANKYRVTGGQPEFMPLGYDQYSQQTFGNKAFLLNAINYLCDDQGLMELRSRVFKIRLLDKVRLREEKTSWQVINVIIPLLLIALFGAVFIYFRRRKYTL
ncbi:MAG TPA: gliding motility-associated ABC transporter substrate-binding protein GldG, partial [Prolixibacteraceae bacterium]|nr:gliding motility-associated ABC transporter substrate-binding protein GldG [Prolixibacteraceae bacterium]